MAGVIGRAFLALFFLVAQIVVAVHTTTAPHAVCPEHGELVHVEGGDDAAGRPHAISGPSYAEGAPPGTEHLHEVCAICSAHRVALEVAPPAEVRRRERLVGRGQAPAGLAEPRATAVYLVAPKQSPPA